MSISQRWLRFWRIAPHYLQTAARREWQLFLLALGGLAPGVAALTAWTRIALWIDGMNFSDPLRGWLLPAALLDLIKPQGVLVGAGVVTLLIGSLGLTNIYLASLKRRAGEVGMFMSLGLRKSEMFLLLLLEVIGVGLFGSAAGVLGGIVLSEIAWQPALVFFQPQNAVQTLDAASFIPLTWQAIFIGLRTGVLAAVLFMGLSAISVIIVPLPDLLRGVHHLTVLESWQEFFTSACGALFAAILTLAVAGPIIGTGAAFAIAGLALLLAALLSGGGWLLTNLYRRLPTYESSPLWSLAVQGLARHPNHTAGMTLALTAGAYGVGLSALAWLDQQLTASFAALVAGMVLVAGASLVLTIASLAALERRWEFGLLMALGARANRVWRLILLEYAIVAIGGGSLGALMALVNWIGSGEGGNWLAALSIIVADLIAALVSAWLGAAPVLWRVTRRSVGQAVR